MRQAQLAKLAQPAKLMTGSRQPAAERGLIFIPHLFSQTTNELWPGMELPFIVPAAELIRFDTDYLR